MDEHLQQKSSDATGKDEPWKTIRALRATDEASERLRTDLADYLALRRIDRLMMTAVVTACVLGFLTVMAHELYLWWIR